ncbi:flavin reductase family protein [Williamsia limnetica]|nr:flavin reductase family protein [Williamsia limnetica]
MHTNSEPTVNHITKEHAEFSSEELRAVMGNFVSGIVVVSAMSSQGPVGFTCQSFSSLSLEPALVSFSPARTSSTWPQIRGLRSFCVNVLAAEQEALSNQFAKSGTDKFAGVQWRPATTGAPMLAGSLAWIVCELWAEYDGGDHTMVVGKVVEMEAAQGGSALTFHRGRYGVTAGN